MAQLAEIFVLDGKTKGSLKMNCVAAAEEREAIVERIQVGCVVTVVIGGYEKRVQVVGLDDRGGRQKGEFRGFILHGDEAPRAYRAGQPCNRTCDSQGCLDCQGDEFVNFRGSNCRKVEEEIYRKDDDYLSVGELRVALAL